MRQEILDEMKRQGINQLRLAQMSGIQQPVLSKWLAGKKPRGATEQTIAAVMVALGIKLAFPRKGPRGRRK